MKITLLIIARNEILNIKLIHDKISLICIDNSIDFFYIDGNSTDGSIEFFIENNIKYKQQIYNGRGGAIRSGFELIKSDAYIIFSPDGNENILDLPKFIARLNNGADLVIASRMMEGAHNEEDGSFFRPRKWANNFFNMIANLRFNRGTYVTDSINGYRAITKQALNFIKLDANDYTIEYQMTMRSMGCNLRIEEFRTHEGERKFGVTGAPSITTGIAFIKRFIIESTRSRVD
jgi:hypothetical protein